MMRMATWMLTLFAALSAVSQTTDEERLFTAMRNRDAATVEKMLQANPKLLQSRWKNRTPFEAAFFIISNQGFVPPQKNDVLAALLRQKPELDIFQASGAGDVARVRELLRTDHSLATAWSEMGWTPLHFAAFGGNVEVMQLLMKEGASSQVNARAKTRFLNTPLQTALLSAQYDTTKYLLEHGADVLVRQSKGFTPLQSAAEGGRLDIVQLLLEHGAEVNSRTDDGRNAYSEALRFGHKDVADYLKSKGATAPEAIADLMKSPD